MAKLITVPKAKQDIRNLQQYVELVESYEADTLEKLIIKEYAFTNSCTEVTKRMNQRGFQVDDNPIEYEYVRSVILGKASDELHKMLKSGFLRRVRKSRGY